MTADRHAARRAVALLAAIVLAVVAALTLGTSAAVADSGPAATTRVAASDHDLGTSVGAEQSVSAGERRGTTTPGPGTAVGSCVAPQTTQDDCDGGVLYHGTGLEAARGIAANGFSVSAAREMGGDGRYYVTERFGDAELFANSNPRYGEPGGEPAVVRADMSVSVEQAVASGLLRPEPLPGAYTPATGPCADYTTS